MAYWIYSELQIMPKIPLIMRDLHTKKQKKFLSSKISEHPFHTNLTSDKNFFFISLYFRTRSSLPWRLKMYFSVRPAAHVRKEPSKVPREVVSSAVSFRVRRNFREKFASQKHEDNTKHVQTCLIFS